MAPVKGSRRGRRVNQAVFRSRCTADTVPAHSVEQQQLSNAPGILLDIPESVGPGAGTQGMERRLHHVEHRMEASDKLLREVHDMVRGLQPVTNNVPLWLPPATVCPAPAAPASARITRATSAPAAPGGPVAAGAPAATGGPDASLAPWPVACNDSNDVMNAHALSEATQDLVASFSSSALSRHSRVSDQLKSQIWSGEYVNIAALLHVSAPQTYSVSLQPGDDNITPMFNVAPKLKGTLLSFDEWVQGYEIYMSVVLRQPHHLTDVHTMLMYIQTIRSLYKKGADWRSYDEAFRSMRLKNDWAWDSVCWPLWMDATHGPQAAAPTGSSFRSKAELRRQARPCFAFNRGEVCNADTCRYKHLCQRCSGPHAVVRCNRLPNSAGQSAGPAVSRSATAGARPTWYRK